MKACRDLQEKMQHELEVLQKAINEIYRTFELCLTEGVKESQDSCEGQMKSTLHPVCIYTSILHLISIWIIYIYLKKICLLPGKNMWGFPQDIEVCCNEQWRPQSKERKEKEHQHDFKFKTDWLHWWRIQDDLPVRNYLITTFINWIKDVL